MAHLYSGNDKEVKVQMNNNIDDHKVKIYFFLYFTKLDLLLITCKKNNAIQSLENPQNQRDVCN